MRGFESGSPAPANVAGYWVWPVSGASSEALFVGRGPQRDRLTAFRDLATQGPDRLCWPRQVHSAIVSEATAEGLCGTGDALVTQQESIALSVATADCVPVVVEGKGHLALIHAGWRGLAQRVIAATLAQLPSDRQSLKAWIGPAIGPCCYEVGWEVAEEVASTSHPGVIRPGNDRPHLDLAEATRAQLQEGGVGAVRTLAICTRCSPEWLWSYRRDRPDEGRNWTFAWRTDGRPADS